MVVISNTSHKQYSIKMPQCLFPHNRIRKSQDEEKDGKRKGEGRKVKKLEKSEQKRGSDGEKRKADRFVVLSSVTPLPPLIM